MQKFLDHWMENTYHLDIPMPVLSVTELILRVEKGTSFTGTLELFNKGEGVFAGIVESVNDIIILKESTIKGNQCVIEYNVNTSLCNIQEVKEDIIIITYNGGEILVPVKVLLFEPEIITVDKKYQPKKEEKKVVIELDQKSYHCEDTGILTIINPTNEKLEIVLTTLDDYIVFNEQQFLVADTKSVEMNFKVTRLDKILGKIPLKTNPEIELNFKVKMKQGTKINERMISTYLTEFGEFPAKRRITTSEEYKNILIQIYRQYCNILLQGVKNKSIDEMLYMLKLLINYDRTNIDLRLAYCILAIEYNKKDLAMKEINNIDRYLLYYDKERMDVSDLLLFFLELIKGESIQELVINWKPINRKTWLKILLKNKYITYNANRYEEYSEIYGHGEKNRLLFSEAVLLMNSNPKIPFKEDKFYKAILTWAIAKKAIGSKWLKKIESSYLSLIQYNNLTEHIATKLYLIDDNKNMLILLCAFYININRIDEEAFHVYYRALFEKCRVVGLEEKYIQAAYYKNELLNFEFLKITYPVQLIEETYKQFYYLNLLIQKEHQKNLYYYHSKDIESMTSFFFKDNLVPDNFHEKTIYIQYLIDNEILDCIISLFEAGKLKDIAVELIVEIIKMIEGLHPKHAFLIAKEAYNDDKYHPIILEVLSRGFKGTISKLLNLYEVSMENGCYSKNVAEEILFKGILTRKHSEEVMDVFSTYTNIEDNQIIQQWMRRYIAAQILIEETNVSVKIMKLLEDIVEKEVDFGMYLALLKVYTKTIPPNDRLIVRLIKELTNAGIFFSWYMQLVPENFLGESHRIQQYFEYNSNTGKRVLFNYRLDDEVQFKKLEMKHVALGLYVVNVIMFYNEGIQYYIEEIDSEGKGDIRSSDLYIKKDIIEQQESESLFDLINTIELSKEMKDIASLHKTVEHYVNIVSKEIEKIYIL